MALAVADDVIRVNATAPGTIATERACQAVLTNETSRQKILSRAPLKRLGDLLKLRRWSSFSPVMPRATSRAKSSQWMVGEWL